MPGKTKSTGKAIRTMLNHRSRRLLSMRLQNIFSNKVLFGDVLYMWLEEQRCRVKPQTFSDYKFIVDKHIRDSLGKLFVNELDASCINQFLIMKRDNGRLDKTGGLSANYLQKIRFVICAALVYASDCRLRVPPGQVAIVTTQKPKPMQVLTVNEQRKLERCLYDDDEAKNIGILLSLYTGMRLGEVCGLRWRDIDLDAGIITVSHTVERIKKANKNGSSAKTELCLCNAKTEASHRIVPIPVTLTVQLRKQKQDDDTFVVPGSRYPFIDPRTYQYYFRKFLSSHGLRKINYHLLRHTFASRCIESGMDMKSLSELLGHASVSITMNIYVHSSMEHKRQQLEEMSRYCSSIS